MIVNFIPYASGSPNLGPFVCSKMKTQPEGAYLYADDEMTSNPLFVKAPPFCYAADVEESAAPNTVTIMQACAMVRVSRRTIYNWIALGKVQVLRTASNAPRIVTASLLRSAS